MICPHCRHKFPLTWARYWREPFGRHTCPECRVRSTLSTGWKYWLLYLPALWLSPLLAIFIGLIAYAAIRPSGAEDGMAEFFAGPWIFVAFFLLLGVCFAVDRIVDERYRRLVPLKGGKGAV